MTGFGEKKESKKGIPRKNPQISGETLLGNAINHHMRGDLVNAEIGYREAIKYGCLDDAIFANLGVIYRNTGRADKAILFYKKAIEINPKNPNAYSNLGNLYQSLGNFECAVAYTSKSLELKPNDPEVLITLGWSQKELGSLNQALASTLKSLELNPDNPTALMNLGGIYEVLGDLKQAIASTLKSLELKPDNPGAIANLCNLCGEGYLPILKSVARRAIEHNRDILNNSFYIEAISSLGKDFARNLISTPPLINQ